MKSTKSNTYVLQQVVESAGLKMADLKGQLAERGSDISLFISISYREIYILPTN